MIKGYIISTLYPHFGNITVLYIHVYFCRFATSQIATTMELPTFDGLPRFPHPGLKIKKERLN